MPFSEKRRIISARTVGLRPGATEKTGCQPIEPSAEAASSMIGSRDFISLPRLPGRKATSFFPGS